MELQLTDDQKLLRETTERFINDTCPLTRVRSIAEGTDTLDASYRTTAAELGWFSMLVPEELGGGSVSGEGLRDLAIIAEECGRRLQPGPFIGTNLVARALAAYPARQQMVSRLVNGDGAGAWVMGAGGWSPGPAISCTATGDGFRLDGHVPMVPGATDADWLLVSAVAAGGPSQFLIASGHPGVTVDPLRSLDITQSFATVTFDSVSLPMGALVGSAGGAGAEIENQLDVALVLISAETVGAADALFAQTVEYAKERTAFGRPIGSFQALKHQLADLSLALEAAKAIAVQAARRVQAGAEDGGSMASVAKAWVSEAAVEVAQGCLQVFGGIGYTWEHDLHLYLRRLTLNSQLYGQARWHRARLWSQQQRQAARPVERTDQMIGPRQPAGESLRGYRAEARAWIESSLERLETPAHHRPIEFYTPEVMAESRALQCRLWKAGYAGIDWPTEYGGGGLSAAHAAAFLDEAQGFRLPDFGILTATTFEVCVPTMIAHAPPAFLEKFVPRVLAGEALVCQYFSEPAAGSDLAAVRTRAARTPEGWLLNGQKVWSTMAHLADWGMCLARTDWDLPKHRGLTWFAVPCLADGVTTRPIRQINESLEFCEEFFEDVAVPDEHRLCEVNQGWAMAHTMLALERGAGHAEDRWPVVAGAVRPELVALARRSGGLEGVSIEQSLAQTQVIDVVERALRARLQERADLGTLDTSVAAYGKLFQGTYDPVRARIRVELGGAAALGWGSADTDGAATALSYLDARIYSIAGGTNEMQRNSIAERALGLPREPSYDTDKPFREASRDAPRWGA